MSQSIDNVYFYQFSSGEHDCYSINGTYYTTECVDASVWLELNKEFKEKKSELFAKIPLRQAYGRMVLTNDCEEFKAHWDYVRSFNPEQVMIDRYNMVAVDIQDEFWRND